MILKRESVLFSKVLQYEVGAACDASGEIRKHSIFLFSAFVLPVVILYHGQQKKSSTFLLNVFLTKGLGKIECLKFYAAIAG